MPKEFYTERDIEDMVKRGIMSLRMNDDVVITDMAYEKAKDLGMNLLRDKSANLPAAPVRPDLSQNQPTQAPAAGLALTASVAPPARVDGAELRQRIHSAVITRLGDQVDAQLLDVIITRVLQSTGIK